MNNNICQNKKLNAYLYTILQWSTFLKRCLPNPRNNVSQVSRNQTLYVTTNRVIKIIIRKRKTWHIDQVANSVDTVKSIHGSI